MIINNNENVKEIAKDLDVNPKTLYTWVTAYKKQHNIPMRSIDVKRTAKIGSCETGAEVFSAYGISKIEGGGYTKSIII